MQHTLNIQIIQALCKEVRQCTAEMTKLHHEFTEINKKVMATKEEVDITRHFLAEISTKLQGYKF